MRFHDVKAAKWRRMKMIGGAFVLLGLAGIGLPNSWALPQDLDDAEPPPEPSGISGEGAQPAYYNSRLFRSSTKQSRTTPPPPRQPPSVSPDHDFYLLSPDAAIPATRSYYGGGSLGRPAPSPAAVLPWNQGGFKDYDALRELSPASSRSLPRKYTLKAVPLAQGPPVAEPEAAVLIVHLPEHALFWVEGKPIRLRGPTSFLPSPPLPPSRRYSYMLRAAWLEDGRWVSQTRKVPVQAGRTEAIYLESR